MGDLTQHRDAVTGEYVTPEYAAANPSTTVRETSTVPDDIPPRTPDAWPTVEQLWQELNEANPHERYRRLALLLEAAQSHEHCRQASPRPSVGRRWVPVPEAATELLRQIADVVNGEDTDNPAGQQAIDAIQAVADLGWYAAG